MCPHFGFGKLRFRIKEAHTSERKVGEEGKESQVTENPTQKPQDTKKIEDKVKIKASGSRD